MSWLEGDQPRGKGGGTGGGGICVVPLGKVESVSIIPAFSIVSDKCKGRGWEETSKEKINFSLFLLHPMLFAVYITLNFEL